MPVLPLPQGSAGTELPVLLLSVLFVGELPGRAGVLGEEREAVKGLYELHFSAQTGELRQDHKALAG